MSGQFEGTSTSPTFHGWGTTYEDPNQDWLSDAPVLGARHEDLERNNPIVAAISETMIMGALGSSGPHWRSLYQIDDNQNVSERERIIRNQANMSVKRAWKGTRFDAAGQRTVYELAATTLRSSLNTGHCYGVRVKKPRPGRQYQLTCVRLVHSSRVSNPNHLPNSDRIFEGIEFDEYRNPIAIHVRRYRHHNIQLQEWDRIPIYDPDTGTKQVTDLPRLYHPDQLRGYGAYTPIMTALKQQADAFKAYVIAKKVQACYPIVCKVNDPERAAKEFHGEVMHPDTKLEPGKLYFVSQDTDLTLLDMKFNGADFREFNKAALEVISAAIGLPYEVVLQRLNESSLASARAALITAWKKFQQTFSLMVEHVLQPWLEWVLEEDIIRGRLPGTLDDLEGLAIGQWRTPVAPSTDRGKDIKSMADAVERLDVSKSTAHAELGFEFGSEQVQRGQDESTQDRAGVAPANTPKEQAPPPGENQEADQDNDDDDGKNNNQDDENDEQENNNANGKNNNQDDENDEQENNNANHQDDE